MDEMLKIGDVAARHGVSTRTLRYYEECGLLESRRGRENQYRFYTAEQARRLEQVLALRRLGLAVEEIRRLAEGRTGAAGLAARRLAALEGEAAELGALRGRLQAVLAHLAAGAAGGDELDRLAEAVEAAEGVGMEPMHKQERNGEMYTTASKLTDVRIVQLKPMRVASYRAESASPEGDAWEVMQAWVKEAGLEALATTRFFGFNNPSPEPGQAVYGYEVWVTLPAGVEPPAPITVKEFGGGLYAVALCNGVSEFGERWPALARWREERAEEYRMGEHQWLEETVLPEGMPGEETQFDLFLPIERVG